MRASRQLRTSLARPGIRPYLICVKAADAFTPDELNLFGDARDAGYDVVALTNAELEPYHPFENAEKRESPGAANGLVRRHGREQPGQVPAKTIGAGSRSRLKLICSQLKDRVGAMCTEDKGRVLGAILFNRSRHDIGLLLGYLPTV